MSLRYPGGLITKNPVVPSTSSAAGIWTLEQALEYIKAGTWPSTGDPYFEYVTMLLHGDGTNGAQNNTFLDSSTNAFSITRNGNTTQGTFSPYGSNWSNYFDGSGDFLSTSVSPATLSGDFTVEGWIYLDNLSATRLFVCLGDSLNATGVAFYVTTGGRLTVYGNNAAILTGTTQSVPTNSWVHVAFVRSSGTIKVYLNGTADSTTASNATSFTGNCRVGAELYNGGLGSVIQGYISSCRIVAGTAVYTSNFTPPPTPLTAIANTSLLTCQSNRFIDNSANALAITVNGNTSVQRFSPFSPTAAYSAATIGGSGYFDGSGDYLTLGGQTELTFGTGDFTVEVWVYRMGEIGFAYDNRPNGTNGAYLTLFAAASVIIYYNTTEVLNAGSIPLNAWTHVAVSRSGTSLRAFVNGLQVGSTVTNSVDFLSGGAGRPIINANGFNTSVSNGVGYISGLRVLKGTALYTANFTPPTSPLTAIANTSLLCNFTNGGIFDNAAMNDLETVGNAQISTAQSKFGGGSMLFDGSGDRLQGRSTPEVTFGTGAFTVEGWLYLNSVASIQIIFDQRPASSNGAYPMLYMNGAAMTWYVSSAERIASSSLTTGTWYHFAVSRSGASTKMFINGTQSGSTYTDSITYLASSLYIGASAFDGGGVLNGYLDEFRITKGVARYTANFTPPTDAFPDK